MIGTASRITHMLFPLPRAARWRRVIRPLSFLPSSHYVLLALMLYLGLELIVAFHRWIVVLAATLLLLLAYGIYLIRQEEPGDFHPLQAVLPVLTASGLAGFALFLPTTPVIRLYFALAALLFYWLLKHGARQAYPTWNWTLSTIVLFLNVAVITGIRFHLFIPAVVMLILVFAVVFLISLQALQRIASTLSQATLLAAAIGLVLTQLAWTMLWLPVHFLVQAGVVVIVYYILFHLIGLSFERPLQRRDYLEYAGLAITTLTLLLLSTTWT